MVSAIAARPPQVDPVLQVGLIGHRHLDAAAIEAITASAGGVLGRIAAAFAASRGRGDRTGGDASPTLRCICSLAEGADTILAQQALAAGYQLSAPLPNPREIYLEDFVTPAARDTFTALLGAARTVFELDGASNDVSYQAAARLLLDQSDILVAVWDGQPERGRGGTGQTVREAMAREIPVVVIDAAAPGAVRVLYESAPDSGFSIEEATARAVGDMGTSPQQDLAHYLGEDLRRSTRIHGLLRWLENTVLFFGNRLPPRPAPAGETPPVPTALPRPTAFAQVEAALGPEFEASDRLAVRYAAYYRLAATARYLSVVPATAAALVGIYGAPPWSRLAVLVQIAVLAGTLLIAYADHRAQWHHRFLDYRLLAEHLRSTKLMALFGSTGPLAKLPPHLAAATVDWVNWRLRDDVRSLGLVTARVDAAYRQALLARLQEEIAGQLQFYRVRSRRFGDLAHILGRLGVALFVIGLTLTLMRQGLAMLSVTGVLFNLTAAFALVIPAFAPVFLGVQSQNEYRQLSGRYAAMAEQLARIERKAQNGLELPEIERSARNLVAVMLAEVSDWHALIGARGISAM